MFRIASLLREFFLAAAVASILQLPMLTSPVFAGDFETPAQGTPERAAIMDGLREPVAAVLRQPVIFVVDTLRVGDGWAFLVGTPRAEDGGPVDYRGTKYGDAIEAGAFDDAIAALLRNNEGRWTVVDYSIGHTDVVWDTWDTEYGAPRALFFPE